MASADHRARFGENLVRARKRGGLSQEEVGIRASLHRTEIGLLERGERMPRIDTAIKLAGALAVPLSELVQGIDWKPTTTHRGNFQVSESESNNST